MGEGDEAKADYVGGEVKFLIFADGESAKFNLFDIFYEKWSIRQTLDEKY